MLQFAPGVKVYLACKPVDMRRGFDGLAADVAQTLRADPYSGAAFVFRSKRAPTSIPMFADHTDIGFVAQRGRGLLRDPNKAQAQARRLSLRRRPASRDQPLPLRAQSAIAALRWTAPSSAGTKC
jgi:transposase